MDVKVVYTGILAYCMFTVSFLNAEQKLHQVQNSWGVLNWDLCKHRHLFLIFKAKTFFVFVCIQIHQTMAHLCAYRLVCWYFVLKCYLSPIQSFNEHVFTDIKVAEKKLSRSYSVQLSQKSNRVMRWIFISRILIQVLHHVLFNLLSI